MKVNTNQRNTDQGNVVVEFVATTIIFLVPIAYIAIAALQVATSYIEVQNAARAGARVFVTSANESLARTQASKAIGSVTGNPSTNSTKFICEFQPCLTPEALVTVEVKKLVNLNLPAFFGTYQVEVTGIQAEVVQDVR